MAFTNSPPSTACATFFRLARAHRQHRGAQAAGGHQDQMRTANSVAREEQGDPAVARARLRPQQLVAQTHQAEDQGAFISPRSTAAPYWCAALPAVSIASSAGRAFLHALKSSRWLRLGRIFGVGPDLGR
jgi:hypothetical protein